MAPLFTQICCVLVLRVPTTWYYRRTIAPGKMHSTRGKVSLAFFFERTNQLEDNTNYFCTFIAQ